MTLKSMKWHFVCLLKKRYTLVFLSTLFLFPSCNNAEEEIEDTGDQIDTTNIVAQVDNILEDQALPQVEIPEGYDILKEAIGDLDGDGIDEKVIVFNTHHAGEMGDERELCIYAEHQGLWSLWHSVIGPVLSSERGGLVGDPFDDLSIRNGEIEINHYGGSIDRWSYNHSYKYMEEEWRLVKATLSYFQVCNYSETYTYDLIKGTAYHSRQKDDCNENGSVIKTTMEVEESLAVAESNEMPLMNGFKPGDVNVDIKGKAAGYRY